jgi:hypothetical protein
MGGDNRACCRIQRVQWPICRSPAEGALKFPRSSVTEGTFKPLK